MPQHEVQFSTILRMLIRTPVRARTTVLYISPRDSWSALR